jgi:tetratricopeptide (TPR) repeat protein
MNSSDRPTVTGVTLGGVTERIKVDELLRTLPEGEIFHLLRDQVLAHSSLDPGMQWASSSAYVTYDKRTLTPEATLEALRAAFAAGQQLYRELFEGYRKVIESVAQRDAAATVRHLVELGDLFELRHRHQHARACYEKALELGESLSDSAPHLLALRRMGRFSQSQGELDRAFSFYQMAYNLARDSRNLMEASASATGLGNIKVDQGKWEQAEYHYTVARIHADETGDEFQMGQLWNNLSVVRRRMGDLEGATGFSDRAIAIFERLEQSAELGRCFNSLGLTQVEAGDFAAARQSFDKALSLAASPYVVAAIHGNLCELHMRQGRFFQSEEEARRGEEIALLHGFNLILVNIYRLLGTLSRLRLDANGVTFFEKAIELAQQYHYLHAQAEAHFEYGLFREALEEDEEAEGHFERALALYRHLDAKTEVKRVEEKLRPPPSQLSIGA